MTPNDSKILEEKSLGDMKAESIIEIGKQCLRDEATAILATLDHIDENFAKAVDMIYQCKGKVIVTGVGKSGHIGRKIAATLASTGTPAFFLNPLDAYHGDLGMVSGEDIVVAISYSGNTDELLRIIPTLLERQVPIVGISGDANSLLAQYSIVHLNIFVEREADPLNLAPTTSTTVTLVMGDALACALEQKRNFKSEDFARFHPGGNLGRRLLTKVENFMVKTNLPIVSPYTKACDAIFEISKNKQGIAVVMENGKIVGAITDGDIRRAMQHNRDHFFSLDVNEVMSHTPKTINKDAKLSEAEILMRQNSIHSLIVVNEQHHLVGIIDYFSCI